MSLPRGMLAGPAAATIGDMPAKRLAGAVLTVSILAEFLGRLWLQHGEAARVGTGNVPTLLVLLSLCVLTTAPLAVLSPGPCAVLACAGVAVAFAAFGLFSITGGVTALITAYLVGWCGPQWLGVALGVPFFVLALAGRGPFPLVLAAVIPTVALAGAVRRSRGLGGELGAVRAASEGSFAEHMARGERATIARELHDVVAHHISMIAVQAETGRLTTPGLPALGARRFAEIGDTARAGLTEMRRLLGVLRPDTAPDPVAELAPQPGLAELAGLVDSAREASGAGCRLIVSGRVARLDPGVELAAFRIVQEALTNTRRHAPGAAVDVELRYATDKLLVRVRDNGPGAPSEGGPGHGLLGMRERAAAVGGSLSAGEVPGGGFLVSASLPQTSGCASGPGKWSGPVWWAGS
jgi:signal transduction histidine kinase